MCISRVSLCLMLPSEQGGLFGSCLISSPSSKFCNVLGSCFLAGGVPSSAMVPSRCCKNLKAGSGLVAGCHLPGSHEWHPLILPLDLATIRDALVLDELSHGSLETKPVFYGL